MCIFCVLSVSYLVWCCFLFKRLTELVLNLCTSSSWGTRWRSFVEALRHKSEGRGSIPNGVIGIFHRHDPSGRTMALGSTQPLRGMSTRNISWGVKGAGA